MITNTKGGMDLEHKGIYIPSIDAKDIYLATHCKGGQSDGYNLKLQNGQYNLHKFTNSLDYSLDLIQLQNIYYRKYRRRDFAFQVNDHSYTTQVINLTFQYSVKEWNAVTKGTFVKFGYYYKSLMFKDCIARNDCGEIVGIQTGEKLCSPVEDLPSYFHVADVEIHDRNKGTKVQKQYQLIKELPTAKCSAELRRELYQ
ncbi:MAG: hypothetical protein K2O73_02695, partial [Lachnospiraceae bacterium]|nr:hypothetical protein [Lachnospiraceae bacterium]